MENDFQKPAVAPLSNCATPAVGRAIATFLAAATTREADTAAAIEAMTAAAVLRAAGLAAEAGVGAAASSVRAICGWCYWP